MRERQAVMAKKLRNLDNEAETGLFGFAIDSLKVVFKPWPDEDQSIFEFVMEKLGALALLLVSVGLIILFLAFLYIRYTH